MSYAGGPPPPPGPPGPGGTAARRRMSPGLLAFLIVDVILVIAVVIAAIVILGGDDDTSSARPSTTTTAPASPTDDADPSEPAEPTTEPGEETTSPEGPTDEPTLFASPSGNISCSISAEGARCGIAQLASKPAAIDSCDGTVGYVYVVTESGVEVPCVDKGDRPKKAEGGTTVLDYGEEATGFGYTCESAEDGVTCRYDETGRGFQLARAGGQVF